MRGDDDHHPLPVAVDPLPDDNAKTRDDQRGHTIVFSLILAVQLTLFIRGLPLGVL